MMDAKQQDEQIGRNLDRMRHEAKDPFYSAKKPIRFVLQSDPMTIYEGYFVRRSYGGYINVAVEPQVRDAIAAAQAVGQPDDRGRALAMESTMKRPIRADGLVLIDHLATISVSDPAAYNEMRRRDLQAPEARQACARAIRQREKQAEIEARLPREQVDAWIIANMGYTAESLAALGKATRRDRRREARKAMMA
jgi:hypothetical protein